MGAMPGGGPLGGGIMPGRMEGGGPAGGGSAPFAVDLSAPIVEILEPKLI